MIPAHSIAQNCAPVAGEFSNFYNQSIIANIGAIETATSGTEFKVDGSTLTPLGAGTVPTHTFKNVEQEYYVQDQWKATPQLTLTAGVRYVYLGVPYEKNGQQIAPTIPLDTFLANRETAADAGKRLRCGRIVPGIWFEERAAKLLDGAEGKFCAAHCFRLCHARQQDFDSRWLRAVVRSLRFGSD